MPDYYVFAPLKGLMKLATGGPVSSAGKDDKLILNFAQNSL
jgi:hypothetical protein